LDDAQLKSRKGKIAVAGRKRDASGAFEKTNKGCSLVVAVLAAPGMGALITISQLILWK
jgi:hypothetical protein